MHPACLLPGTGRLLLLCALWLGHAAHLTAAAASPLIQDQAQILSQQTNRLLQTQLETCRTETGVSVYVLTFAGLEDQPMVTARTLQQSLPANEAALILAFAWGMKQPVLLPSNALSEHYPVRDLTLLLAKSREPFQYADGTLGQKFLASAQTLTTGLRKLEETRQKDSVRHFPAELFISLAAVLVGAALLLGVSLLWLQAGSARPVPHHFPEVQVGTRLGAPYGGGLMAMAGSDVSSREKPRGS